MGTVYAVGAAGLVIERSAVCCGENRLLDHLVGAGEQRIDVADGARCRRHSAIEGSLRLVAVRVT
jgi:hypothetical protein